MRWVVLDASVAVKWYVAETDTERAVALLEADNVLFLAPDLLPAEVVNALLRQSRAGQLTEEALDKALRDLSFSAPELIASTRLWTGPLASPGRWPTRSMTASVSLWPSVRRRFS